MANKYRVKKGGITIKGRRFTEGQVINTDLDLAAMFKNKVKVLSGPEPERSVREEIVEEDLDEDTPKKAKKKAAAPTDEDESGEESAEAAESDSDESEEAEPPRKKKKKKKH